MEEEALSHRNLHHQLDPFSFFSCNNSLHPPNLSLSSHLFSIVCKKKIMQLLLVFFSITRCVDKACEPARFSTK